MTSKWIKDLTMAIFSVGKGLPVEESPNKILDKINSLLKRAMLSTDDEALHDEIEKEIKNGE